MDSALAFEGIQSKRRIGPFNKHYGIGAVLVGHRCVVFGGYHSLRQEFWVYDIAKRSWKQYAPINHDKLYGRVRMAFMVDDVLYVYLWSPIRKRYSFLTLDLVCMEEWIVERESSHMRMRFGTSGSYVECRNEGVLFGGEINSTEVLVYNVERASWYCPKTTGSPPSPRFNHTTCSYGRHMFVLGGIRISSRPATGLELYSLDMDGTRFTWSTPKVGGYLPQGRYLFSAACISERIFVFGGYSGHTSFDIYSFEHKCWRKGYYEEASGKVEGFRFKCDWIIGTSDHAMVLTPQNLVVFGGFQLPIGTPLHITPLVND